MAVSGCPDANKVGGLFMTDYFSTDGISETNATILANLTPIIGDGRGGLSVTVTDPCGPTPDPAQAEEVDG